MSSTQEVGEIFGAGAGPAHAMLRSPTVLIASIGLWGMNIYFFRVFGIDYVKVLHHDLLKLADTHDNSNHTGGDGGTCHRRGWTRSGSGVTNMSDAPPLTDESDPKDCNAADVSVDDEEGAIMGDVPINNNNNNAKDDAIGDEITAPRLVVLSLTLLILLHSTYLIWIDWLGGGSIGAIFAFYGAVTTAILFPLQSTRWLRHTCWLVFLRSLELINPRCHCLTCRNPCSSKSNNEGVNTSNSNNGNSSSGDVLAPLRTPRPIPFIDVFFADAMCSLSKVFFDWGMLLHMASYYPKPVPASAWNILIPSAFAALPFLIRARQCLVMWTVTKLKNDPSRYQHLWNALKYSTSIFPLCLSAYQKTVMKERAHELEAYLIFLLAINAGYALWWDIVMDWGMMKNPTVAATVICNPVSGLSNNPNGLSANNSSYLPLPTRDHLHSSPSGVRRSSSGSGLQRPSPTSHSCWYLLLRNRLRFGVAMSVLILLTDVVLRFSWVLRFYHKLFPSGDSFVLCTQFLEVFRRAIWNLLRVEWENLKQSGHHLPSKPVVSPAATVQMIPVSTDWEEGSFLQQRGGHVGNEKSLRKIPYEKNAEA